MFTEDWLPPDNRRGTPQYAYPDHRSQLHPGYSAPLHHPQSAPSGYFQYQHSFAYQPYSNYPETSYDQTSQYTYPMQVPAFWQKQAPEPYDDTTLKPSMKGDSTVIERLQLLLPAPPLAKAPLRPEPLTTMSPRRTKRKSKFTREQDQLILSLKRQGRSWVEIADITNVGSYLAARNRYQVIVGQQGSTNLSFSPESKQYLQKLLDAGELCKWDYIAQRLSRSTGKHFTSKACREYARFLLFSDPESLGVNQRTVQELEKEHEATDKLLKQAVLSSPQ
ncbi:hypothetical protein FT663_02825 [Candidozyma haemuli var. vulneris]|uniref:Myb-like domain-containing protein n=1 Tax=Candidozyma haemuli TaxID=45357 RepID=A0A2V1AZQ7_9ASCO|nr:hypothetical protein CXQ85_003837 [[Candida] haemuloni]KAF3989278.1 hypothetical protein FT662_02922 [[Candida] haemuloni var. vulneris]KAF3991217.1 hypothetical protein FT663_02825 [[Candida] haemuloni var. vulneris]PVH23547.1 hypothetical protein CXQ85_003837 [[Candida] haemuloni]